MTHRKEVLPNGIRTIISEQQGTEAVTAMVFVRVGSRNEKNSIAGIAHFIEHLAFKGTKSFPTTQHIAKALDSVGAEYNAFTSKDYTGYYVKVAKEHLDMALHILGDMTFYPLYDEAEIKREKGVIIEEMNMYEDTPMYMSEEYFEEQLYDKHPLGRLIIGNKKTVTNTEKKDILDFHNKYYQPENIVVSIAGSIPDNTTELVRKYFTKKQKTKKPKTKQLEKLPEKKSVLIKQKETEQVHLVVGLPVALNYGHKNLLQAKLANAIFGGSMSSRLFTNIRERQGLCYYVRSGLNLYEDVANWQVSAGVDRNRLDKAVQLIIKEWQRLEKGITQAEFDKAREYLKGKMALQLEDSSAIAQWYAKQELFDVKLTDPEQYKQKLDKMTRDKVNTWLKQQVKQNRLRLTLIGPYSDVDYFKKFLP